MMVNILKVKELLFGEGTIIGFLIFIAPNS